MGFFLWACLRDRLGDWRRLLHRGNLFLLGLFLFFSMLPDLDAVAGVLTGDMGRFHNQFTHSLAFVLAGTALPAAVFSKYLRRGTFRQWATVLVLPSVLHLLLDTYCYGRGLKLLWPFSHHRFQAPVEVFGGLHWSEGLWYAGHLQTILEELRFSALLLLAALLWRRWNPASDRDSGMSA